MSEQKQFFPSPAFSCRDDSQPKDPEIRLLASALLSDGEPASTTPTARPCSRPAWQQLTPEQLDDFNSLT